MKKMDYQNVRGTQDYLPEQEVTRRAIRRTLEDTFMAYGCKPIETPILNYTELMASKYAGGAEILQEMYTLTDRGERDLALRYDLTIPFAKVVAMNPSITMPFKRYEIGKVFRDGPIKAGRFREFTQCDVDIVGVTSQAAEAELMLMAIDAFDRLNLQINIQYNNRKLLVGLLQLFEVEQQQMNQVILILDKIEKIDQKTMLSELRELGISENSMTKIKKFLEARPEINMAYFNEFANQNTILQQGIQELVELTAYLNALGLNEKCTFNPFLARGLEIYTATIYEIFLADGTIRSSIGSGGRYDQTIGGLLGSEEQSYATVGISFGLDVIYTALEVIGRIEQNVPIVDIYIIPLGTEKSALKLAAALRQHEYKVEVELSGKKVKKAMEKANRENTPQVIVLGEDEVTQNMYKIKNMQSGKEEVIAFKF
ncbi:MULTISPECIES: histidine--tRNA ligase [Lysinibacillus]|uniref:histidine--tRNA ligase n=1 Tax=Lysinibacillus TaxID=400634 RepID=UPI0004D7DF88|nr:MULTISPECIES: histidine--tRNA ligase [Lysinibacillus]MDC6269636.1 histidine--tRNA ligase [Lysinibacillus sphaericus]AJK85989.1 histidine--tRNA ligase [Lysinibacillus fusiformis]KHK55495.1 histidine--tRNA ligase [Lysinibacillus sp. A1]MCE4045534.1 histidine--tRNA ligase [Lysinibacillus fusiformis]MDN4970581.1 histidine--tRNA ligase [Lysinibacillus fusiformis]